MESPEGPTGKRKRKTYSCADCRRRKLKCDREQPCGRCRREDHPHTCLYNAEDAVEPYGLETVESATPIRHHSTNGPKQVPVQRPRETADLNKTSTAGSVDTVVSLKRKVEHLESRIAALESTDRTSTASGYVRAPISPNSGDVGRQEELAYYFRGKGFKTQFFGATNAMSMLTHFPEIHSFARDPALLQTPIARMQMDLQAMSERVKERRRQREHVSENMRTLLPSHEVVNRLLRLYFDTYEQTYRILHGPSFWTKYGSGFHQSWSERFTAIVLLICASVNCLSTTDLSFHDDISTAREDAETWIASVDSWLLHHSQKRFTLEHFQIQCLLLLAKRNNIVKKKRFWINSGTVLRIAISTGLHLESGDMNARISTFDQEMRRRIWATIVEWDLSVSTARGVPPLASSISSTCGAPTNINDDQINESSLTLPESKPLSEKTETSFLSASAQSLSLRTSLTSMLNDPNVYMSFEDAMKYESRIQQELDKLPAWVRRPNARTCGGNPSVFQSITFEGAALDIQLRQYLIFLYNPFTKNGAAPVSQQAYSRMACMTASEKIIDYHFKLAAAGNHSLNLQGTDLFAGVITISLNTMLEVQSATMAKTLATSLQPLVEGALDLLEDKVLRLGEWYHQYWFASAAFAFASCRVEERGEDAARNKAVERVSRLYYKVLAFQNKRSTTPASIQTPFPSGSALTPQQPLAGPDLSNGIEKPELPPLQNGGPQYDFANLDGIQDWDLDDLWGFETINL